MMVLDACHASIERGFEAARKALAVLTLEAFLGEDISNFATAAQQKIQILLSVGTEDYEDGIRHFQQSGHGALQENDEGHGTEVYR
jgi:hypothetical protein